MRQSIAATLISNEAQVAADTLTEVSIQFDNIDEEVLPDSDLNHSLGSAIKRWNRGFIDVLDTRFIETNLCPITDGSNSLGTAASKFSTIYVNDIQGDARALIIAGLLF